MNYYCRHIGDYLKDTAHLSLLEHGVYTRLLDVYYIREQPFAPGEAARLVGARTKDEKAAVESVLAEFFQDGRQDRCDREIARFERKAAHNQEVGKLGGRPRKTGTQAEPNGNPDGLRKEPKPNPPNSQEPIANKEENPLPPAGVPPLAKRAARKVPEGFEVTAEMRHWAKDNTPTVDVDLETAKFKDHTFATSCIDWPGRWRNWLRKAPEFVPKGNGATGETAWQRSQRERAAELHPAIARAAPGQPKQNPMEILDGLTRIAR